MSCNTHNKWPGMKLALLGFFFLHSGLSYSVAIILYSRRRPKYKCKTWTCNRQTIFVVCAKHYLHPVTLNARLHAALSQQDGMRNPLSCYHSFHNCTEIAWGGHTLKPTRIVVMMQIFFVSFQNTSRGVTFAKWASLPKNTKRQTTSISEVTCSGEKGNEIKTNEQGKQGQEKVHWNLFDYRQCRNWGLISPLSPIHSFPDLGQCLIPRKRHKIQSFLPHLSPKLNVYPFMEKVGRGRVISWLEELQSYFNKDWGKLSWFEADKLPNRNCIPNIWI